MLPTQGILNPSAGDGRFTLSRRAPSQALGSVVERYWIIHWDLRGRPAHEQETLPYPCVNLVFGTHRPGVHGPSTRRFVAQLRGLGWVFGVKFRPSGFRGFCGRPMVQLVDSEHPIEALFAEAGAQLDRAMHAAENDDARLSLVEKFLLAYAPPHDPDAELVSTIVDIAAAEREISRVAQLAARVRLPVRTLERLMRSYVGVTPKGVIRRFRVQEAAARVGAGRDVAWSQLARELGYFDQAHFIRDFKAQIGRTPAQYAAWCAQTQDAACQPRYQIANE